MSTQPFGSVTCPHCHFTMHQVDMSRGEVFCQQCGQKFAVAGDHPMAPPGAPGDFYPPQPARSSIGGGAGLMIGLAIGGVLLLACSGVLVALLLPAVQAARSAAQRMQSANNMKEIALAMHNYHDTYKCLPPAYIADEQGKPRTSWRALILPFLMQGDLFDQYDFNVAWDDPRNAMVRDTTVPVYQSITAEPAQGETNYMMVSGPGTIGDGQACRFRDITDGTSNTLLVVEVKGLGVNWAEPRDITVAQLEQLIASGKAEVHLGGFNVAVADGSVRFISVDIDPMVLEAICTRSGGERVSIP